MPQVRLLGEANDGSGRSRGSGEVSKLELAPEGWEVHADRGAELEDKGDEHLYEAAAEYAEAAKTATGWQIAERTGRDEPHISRCIAVHQLVVQGQSVGGWSRDYSKVKQPHVAANAGDNEWYTPPEYIRAATQVMGGIDLDPASTSEANDIIGAAKFYTQDDNGLLHGWGGRVWMNPPYARPLIDEFCGKLAEEYAAGNVQQAITLTNNATETGWFHALAEVGAAIAFPRHRVKFWHPRKEATPLQGQACFYLGENIQGFRDEFVQFGFTVLL
jgi:phage N-6-adenine-methyltransferase